MLYNLQFVAKTEKNAKGSVWRHDYIQLGYLRPLIIVEITIKYYAGAASRAHNNLNLCKEINQ